MRFKVRSRILSWLLTVIMVMSSFISIIPLAAADTLTDTIPPTWQNGTLNAAAVTGNSLTLDWTGAQDDTGVTGYKIYKNNSVMTAVYDVNTFDVSGLQPATPYNFAVQALDASGNESSDGPNISITTEAEIFPLAPVSAVTDHLGKTVTLEFDRAMNDPAGRESQFSVDVNGTAAGISAAALGSDSKQILLYLVKPIGYAATPKAVTVSYTAGDVTAVDGTALGSFSERNVTNNIISLELVDYEPVAAETTCEDDPSGGKILTYTLKDRMDYDNVNLAIYFSNGFFRNLADNLSHPYVRFYNKDTGEEVAMPNILTEPVPFTGALPNRYMEYTDWYFKQISGRVPLGLALKSCALQPDTTYVVEVLKGFSFHTGPINNTYKFEFTTTVDSRHKPSWPQNAGLTTPYFSDSVVRLQWPAAEDNHGAAYTNGAVYNDDDVNYRYIPNLHYNIYQNNVLIGTADEKATTYDVSNLNPGTTYAFKIEAVDFAGNVSPALETTITIFAQQPPVLTADTTDNLCGYDVEITFKTDSAWQAAITDITVNSTSIAGKYIVDDGVISIDGDIFTSSGDYVVVVKATGYSDATVTQNLLSPAYTGPTWPEGSSLTATDIAQKELTLTWSAATDDVAVTGYRVYQGDTLLTATPVNDVTYHVTGLTAGTEYTFTVQAGDAAGNWSTTGPDITITTQAMQASPVLLSAGTDHLGNKIVLEFDKSMADPTGMHSQFTVKLGSNAKTIKGMELGGDPKQIILTMSGKIGAGTITIDYSKGSVAAADGTELASFTGQVVTNNYVSTLELVDYEPAAEEIAYDASVPIIKYELTNLVDYDNVNMAFYFANGFFRSLEDNLKNYVKFYEKNTGSPVVLPNIVTVGMNDSGTLPTRTWIDGSQRGYMEITDWYFWQIQWRSPLGLALKSQALKPDTTYVIEVQKGFVMNNGGTTKNTFYFEFTTTKDSLTKPYWQNGSINFSDLGNESLKLNWSAAQDNHGVTGYNIFQDGTLLQTVAGTATSCVIMNLTPATQYIFTVEAFDFAGSRSTNCLEKTVTTLSSNERLTPPVLTGDSDDNIIGNVIDITFTDDAAWRAAINGITVDGAALSDTQYTVAAGIITLVANTLAVGNHTIVIGANGYSDAMVEQTVLWPAAPVLAPDNTNNVLGNAVDLSFTDDAAWRAAISSVTVDGTVLTGSQYQVSPGNITINSAGSILTTAGEHVIIITAAGYRDATLTQTMLALLASPSLTADGANNTVGNVLDLGFTDDAAWRAAINGIIVDGAALVNGQYSVIPGNINIAAGVLNTAGSHTIVVKATGYYDALVVQTVGGTGAPVNIFKTDPGIIITIAGNGTSGYAGDGGPATSAKMKSPMGVALDSSGNLYIADAQNHQIREVAAVNHIQYGINMIAGNIYTVAGNGTAGYSGDGGVAVSAKLNYPQEVSLDNLGNLYIADSSNHCIRKVDTSGTITTVAGTGTYGYSGDSGPAAGAQMNTPYGVVIDSMGNMFIPDYYGHCVRMVAATNQSRFGISMVAGNIYTVAGTGIGGYNGDDIKAENALINHPRGVSLDKAGNLYIVDSLNYRIRKVDAGSGIISTVAGTGISGVPVDGAKATETPLLSPLSAAVDADDNLYLGLLSDYRLRKVDAGGTITTVAGTGTSGYTGDGGLATDANVKQIRKVMADSEGNLFLSDSDNNTVRYIQAQSAILTPPSLNADEVDNTLGNAVDLTFADDNVWRAAISSITVDGVSLTADQYTVSEGNININPGAFSTTGNYTITVKATGYSNASVTQNLLSPAYTGPTWPEGSSLTATDIAQKELTLTWSGATDDVAVTGYRVYQGDTLLTATLVADVTYHVTGLSAGTEYTFTVQAGDAAGNWSTDGPSVTVTTSTSTGGGGGDDDTQAPTWPANAKVTVSRSQTEAVLTWPAAADNKGVTGYRIKRDGVELDTVDGNTTTYTDTGLERGNNTYAWSVEAVDAAGNWSTAITGQSLPGQNPLSFIAGQSSLTTVNGDKSTNDGPIAGSATVPVNPRIRLYFDRGVTTDAVWDNNQQCITLQDSNGSNVSIDVFRLGSTDTINDNLRYIFLAPTSDLTTGKTYKIIISKNLIANNGHTLGENNGNKDEVVTFTVAGSPGAPGGGGGGGAAVTTAGPTFTTGSASVDPAVGATVSLGDMASVVIPANALKGTGSVTVEIKKVTPPPAIPAGFRLAGEVYEFSVGGQTAYSFAQKVALTFQFDPSLIGAGEVPAVYYYDESLHEWVNLGGTVSGSTITVLVDHFTKYAVFAVPKPATQVETPPTPGTFNDIDGHWAQNKIEELVALGVVSGYPDGSFKPDGTITRAEFATMLVKAFELSPQGGKVFADNAGHWASDYIATAAASGLVSGYDANTFGPDDLITREQIAVMIVKALSLTMISEETTFSDNSAVSGWAKDAVATAAANGLMTGYPDNTFQPLGSATRAEAVTVILSALNHQ